MTTQHTIEPTYTISQTAHVLSLPERVVDRLIDDGEITTVPIPSGVLVTARSVHEFVQRLVDEAQATRRETVRGRGKSNLNHRQASMCGRKSATAQKESMAMEYEPRSREAAR